jgi:hypothetical protein
MFCKVCEGNKRLITQCSCTEASLYNSHCKDDRKMSLDSRNIKKYNPHEQTLKISEIKSICKLHKILVHESFEEVFD